MFLVERNTKPKQAPNKLPMPLAWALIFKKLLPKKLNIMESKEPATMAFTNCGTGYL